MLYWDSVVFHWSREDFAETTKGVTFVFHTASVLDPSMKLFDRHAHGILYIFFSMQTTDLTVEHVLLYFNTTSKKSVNK